MEEVRHKLHCNARIHFLKLLSKCGMGRYSLHLIVVSCIDPSGILPMNSILRHAAFVLLFWVHFPLKEMEPLIMDEGYLLLQFL